MPANPDALRIHFCAVGSREVDRVCGPLRALKADRVHLLRTAVNDPEAPYRDRVREVLQPLGIEVKEDDVVMRHPALVAFQVGTIVQAQPTHNYRFNLSSGPREAGLGGFMASMFWEIQPYVSLLREDAPPAEPDWDEHPFSNIVNVPCFRQPMPRDDLLDALAWMVEQDGPVKQAVILAAWQKEKIIRSKKGETGAEAGADGPEKPLSAQAAQGQFRSLMDALERMGFARRAAGGSHRWEASDQAEAALAMFRGRRIA